MKTTAEKVVTRSGPGAGGVLADPQWLEDHLGDPRVRVVEVDVSPAAYQDWHVQGAVLWNIYSDLKDPDYQLAATAALERLVARSGIAPATTVVFYGYAPALGLWLLKLYGHRDVRILDCSRDRWRSAGRPCSSAASTPAAGSVRLGRQDTSMRADWAAAVTPIRLQDRPAGAHPVGRAGSASQRAGPRLLPDRDDRAPRRR
jgi:thiosulfate/3-mercaptopyruvate sulfurtransferase